MILLPYIFVFVCVFFLRYRLFIGAHLRKFNMPDGRTFFYTQINSGGGYTRSPSIDLMIGIPLDADFTLMVQRKPLLIDTPRTHKFLINNAELDFYLDIAPDTQTTAELIKHAQVFQEQLRFLFRQQTTVSLYIRARKMWVVLENMPNQNIQDDVLYPAVRSLYAVAEGLKSLHIPTAKQNYLRLYRKPHYLTPPVKATLFSCAHLATAVTAAIGLLSQDRAVYFLNAEIPVIFSTGMFALTFSMLWLIWMHIQLAKSPWLTKTLRDFIIFGIVGFVLAGWHATRSINIHLDTQPPAAVTLSTAQKRCSVSCSKYEQELLQGTACDILLEQKASKATQCSIGYQLVLRHPKSTEDLLEVSVSAAVFQKTQPEDTLTVWQHPGWLGIAWIDFSESRPKSD